MLPRDVEMPRCLSAVLWLLTIVAGLPVSPDCSGSETIQPSTCRDVVSALAVTCAAAPTHLCSVVFEPGVYFWNSTRGPVLFKGLTGGIDITVAQGPPSVDHASPLSAEFITFGQALSGLFRFENVTGGIAITGLSVDSARLPYTYGRVVSVADGAVTLAFNRTQYPFYLPGTTEARDAPWLAAVTNIYGAIDPVLRVPKQPMHWGGGGDLTVDIAASTLAVKTQMINASFVGEWVVIEHNRRAAPVFDFYSCEGVVVTDVTLYSHAGFGFMFTAVNRITLDSVVVTTRTEQRPMSILADGAHFRKCSGYIHIVDSVFERNGDDCFASHSEYSSVIAVVNQTCVKVAGEGVDLAGEDELWVFRKRANLTYLATLTVTGVSQRTKTLCFNATLPEGLEPNDVLTSEVAPHILIERVRLWANLGHGLRIKTPNVLVRDCTLGYNSFGAILMIPDAAKWMSSMAVHNVTVENCSITNGDPWATAQYDVESASITVTAYVPEYVGATAGDVKGAVPVCQGTVNNDVTIRGNTIVQAAGVCTAVLMRATASFVVTNNTVIWPNRVPDGCTVLHALNSVGTCFNNHCTADGKLYDCGAC